MIKLSLKRFWPEFTSLFVLFIGAFILVIDLFLHTGRPLTFDGRIHATTFAQFYRVLSGGEFPVLWANSYATYGFPLPFFVHQLPAYVGAGIIALTHNAAVAMALFFLGIALLSTWLMYVFLRLHVGRLPAFAGAFLYNFAPYRIVDVYTRGALPEFMSSLFMLSGLIGLNLLIVRRRQAGGLLFLLSVGVLALTHPMMIFPTALLLGSYGLLLLWQTQRLNLKWLAGLATLGILGLLLSSYYILPLFLETSYLHFGQATTHLREGQARTLEQLFASQWQYFGATNPGPLGENITLGVIEVCLLGLGVVTLFLAKDQTKRQILGFWLGLLGVTLLLITPWAVPLFRVVPFLNGMQYSWRLLSIVIIMIPIVAAYLLEWFGTSRLVLFLCVLVLLARIPALYGKNFLADDPNMYYATRTNLYVEMNTLWMGEGDSYRPRTSQFGLLEGKADITPVSLRNSSREYRINAITPVRLVDYTFFFPGWLVESDGQQVPIEFQDPNYRGLITYRLEPGQHDVRVFYVLTRTKKVAYLISLMDGVLVGGAALVMLGRSLYARRNARI